jgi:chemotaxis protein MotB
MAANPQQADAKARPIYVKRVKKVGGGHHGGAWKVAYADFVTAMMAFFMVMWLVTAVSKDKRAAIFDYFKNPSMEPGKSVKPAPGQMGPGGASTAAINLGGGLDAPKTSLKKTDAMGNTVMTSPAPEQRTEAQKQAEAEEAAKLAEQKQLDALMQDLKEAIGKSQALQPFKDQLLLDITAEGLRIQILDAQNRPMFDMGASRLKNYTSDILKEVTQYLITVPNQVSLTGHTDATPYAGITGFTNWDLSTDRANAARRAIEASGFPSERIAKVVGMGSSVLFDKENPRNAVNRRISIVVITREAVESSTKKAESNLLGEGGSGATPITDSRVVPNVSITGAQSFSIPAAPDPGVAPAAEPPKDESPRR